MLERDLVRTILCIEVEMYDPSVGVIRLPSCISWYLLELLHDIIGGGILTLYY